MKKIFLLMIGLVIIASCSNTKREYSDVIHEDAVVVTLLYSPSQHKTELTGTMMDDYTNPIGGTDWNGNKGIKIGKINGQGVQITNTTIPEKYGIVFQCQHSTFTIQGPLEDGKLKYKILHDKLSKSVGDTVDVLYKEIYDVTYDDKDKSKVVKKVLVDYDFIDAQVKK